MFWCDLGALPAADSTALLLTFPTSTITAMPRVYLPITPAGYRVNGVVTAATLPSLSCRCRCVSARDDFYHLRPVCWTQPRSIPSFFRRVWEHLPAFLLPFYRTTPRAATKTAARLRNIVDRFPSRTRCYDHLATFPALPRFRYAPLLPFTTLPHAGWVIRRAARAVWCLLAPLQHREIKRTTGFGLPDACTHLRFSVVTA